MLGADGCSHLLVAQYAALYSAGGAYRRRSEADGCSTSGPRLPWQLEIAVVGGVA